MSSELLFFICKTLNGIFNNFLSKAYGWNFFFFFNLSNVNGQRFFRFIYTSKQGINTSEKYQKLYFLYRIGLSITILQLHEDFGYFSIFYLQNMVIGVAALA